MTRSVGSRTSGTTADPVVLAARVTAVLTVAVLVYMFVTAGSLIGPTGSVTALDLHSVGAIVLHLVAAAMTAATAALWWTRGAAWWPAVVSLLVFVVSFPQAASGSSGDMTLHVPSSIALTIGTVVVATWAFAPSATRRAAS